MNYLVKVLEPAFKGYVIHTQFTLTGETLPPILDVPCDLKDGESPLRRYRLRLLTDEAVYYTPIENEVTDD